MELNKAAGEPRRLGRLDTLLGAADRALKVLLVPARAQRPLPAPREDLARACPPLDAAERRAAAALMRVNHAGELAAQALYHGQALVARDPPTREFLLQAAREEADHLAWCEQRLTALGARSSRLNPLWYAGSLAIGAFAGSLGERASLGFMAETERQVEGHLSEHLERLPSADRASRAVLERMREDEVRHGLKARQSGAASVPWPVRELMRASARVMTYTARWI